MAKKPTYEELKQRVKELETQLHFSMHVRWKLLELYQEALPMTSTISLE